MDLLVRLCLGGILLAADPAQVHGNRTLELIWTVTPCGAGGHFE
jgi:hypothetical protein